MKVVQVFVISCFFAITLYSKTMENEIVSNPSLAPIQTLIEEPSSEKEIVNELPPPKIIVSSPKPRSIKTSGSAFYFVRYVDAEKVSLSIEDVVVTSDQDLVCKKELSALGPDIYVVMIFNCRGSGNLNISIPNETAENKNGKSKGGFEGSEFLMVKDRKRVAILEKRPEPLPPAPVQPPIEPQIVYIEPERVPVQAEPVEKPTEHEVLIPRPKSGAFWLRTDLTSYLYKSDDEGKVVRIKRPVTGDRFVEVRYLEDGKKILYWKRSDRPGESFEPSESGDFKIELGNLRDPQIIKIEPVYSK